MYNGPIIDTFLHTPWFGEADPDNPRGDESDWGNDPRLLRVMRLFHHVDADGARVSHKTAEEILADMDAAGVERAILPAKVYYAASEAGVRAVHEAMAKLEAESSGRFKCVATIVPPELGPATYWDVMKNSRLLQEAHERYGFIGVHLTPAPWGTPPNHKWFYPLYAKCVELGLALYTYVGMPGALWPMSPNDPSHLEEVALAFPDLKIVAHHLGDPWIDVMIRLAARHENFYICTSTWSPKSYPPALLQFMRGKWHGTHGCEKVCFASDYPLLDLKKTTTAARQLDLSEGQLARFLYENAQQLHWS